MNSVRRNGGSDAQAAAEAARRAAERARIEAAKVAAAAAKAAAALAAKKDTFKGVSAGIGAGASAAAKLEPVVAQAKAEVGKAGTLFAQASAELKTEPQASAIAGGLAAEAKTLSLDPSKAFGPLTFDVGSMWERAKNAAATVKDTATGGYELLTEGAKKLGELAGGLDQAKERAIDEVREKTIDGPIDSLNSEGDSVKVNAGVELEVVSGVPGLNIKGLGDASTEIKRDEDGGYTISTEANVLGGVSVGAEDPAAGNSASADGLIGGGGKVEFKVKPVLNEDGTVNEVATKAKAKELTEAIARQAVVAGAPVGTQSIVNAAVGPTEAQRALMTESFKGVELKGSAAIALAAKLNLPGFATLDLAGKGQQDFTLRIEKGDKGLVVSTKNTLAGEFDIQGAGGPANVYNAGANVKAKVELEQRFEYPGINSVNDVIEKGSTVQPEVKQTMTVSTDGQLGLGAGGGVETGVVGGNVKRQGRLGATVELKIDVTNSPQVIRDVATEAMKGDLESAAKKAGDATNLELKTTVYVESSRQADVAGGNKTVAKGKAKVELLERDVLLAPPAKKATASEVATQVREQVAELQRRQAEMPRSPILMRG
ncbi:MAG: hypothetical protein ACO1OB_22090 [Archangium sp.]